MDIVNAVKKKKKSQIDRLSVAVRHDAMLVYRDGVAPYRQCFYNGRARNWAIFQSLEQRRSSCEYLDNTVSTGAHYQPSVAAPANIADAFSSHGTMRYNVLRANPLL